MLLTTHQHYQIQLIHIFTSSQVYTCLPYVYFLSSHLQTSLHSYHLAVRSHPLKATFTGSSEISIFGLPAHCIVIFRVFVSLVTPQFALGLKTYKRCGQMAKKSAYKSVTECFRTSCLKLSCLFIAVTVDS